MKPALRFVTATLTRRTPFSDWPELLSVEEGATVVGTSKGVLYQLVAAGTLPCVRFGKLIRIRRDDLRATTTTATTGTIQ